MTEIYNAALSTDPPYKYSSLPIEQLGPDVWVNANVNGTSDASQNVTSVSDTGTGKVTINFSITMAAVDYVALCTPQIVNSGGRLFCRQYTSQTTTTCRFDCVNSTPAYADPTEWNIAILGNRNI